MASLKELRARINSVKSTQKITSAMKMVAAAKLRRAQEPCRGRAALRRAHGAHAELARRGGGGDRVTRRCSWPAPARSRTICWW